MAKPTKFTEAIAAEILKALRAGMLMQDAAEFAGIHKDTLYTWMAKGAKRTKKEDLLRKFSDDVTKARSEAKFRAVARVHAGMAKDWKAAAWWLGVSDPKNYGPKVRITLEQEFSDALTRIRKRLPLDVYEKVLDAITEGDGGEGESSPAPGEELPH